MFNTVLNNKNYVIVENGSLIPEKENADVRDLRIITTKNTPTLPDYKKTFKVEHLQQLSSIYDEIKLNLIRIQIEAIAYYPIERESIVTIA